MELRKSLGIDKDIIGLENLVTGYKINDTAFCDINYIFTIISLSIYTKQILSKKKRQKK